MEKLYFLAGFKMIGSLKKLDHPEDHLVQPVFESRASDKVLWVPVLNMSSEGYTTSSMGNFFQQ